jgi:phosphoenolpyruvate carboxykinase (ATP)
VTDITVYEPEKIGLAKDSKVLLLNDGAVKGRCAAARRIFGEPGVEAQEYAIKIRDVIYDTRYKNMY